VAVGSRNIHGVSNGERMSSDVEDTTWARGALRARAEWRGDRQRPRRAFDRPEVGVRLSSQDRNAQTRSVLPGFFF
jgi:hypothetical protein